MNRMSDKETVKSRLGGLGILKILKPLKEKGTYTLVIFVPVERRIVIGKIGDHKFSEGYYAYTGSAFGKGAISLGGRILRHLRKEKKKMWHIDYLLSGDNATVTAVIAANTKEKMECEINCYLRDKLQASIPVLGFGSSDCRERCGSHLLHLGKHKNVVKRIAELYSEKIDAKVCIFDLC